MSKPAIDFSRPFDEICGGGGSFFDAGMYRCTRSVFGYFDFGKKGNDSLTLIQDLQPLNTKGKDEGDEITRYFAMGGKAMDGTVFIEPCDPVKGTKGAWKSIRFTDNDKYGQIRKTSEFGVFLEYCEKNGVDMDAVQNDITAFEGNVYEYGTVDIKKTKRSRTPVEEAEDGGKPGKPDYDSKTYVVIVSQPKAGKKPAAKEEDDTPAPAKKKKVADDEDDAKPSKKSSKPKGPGAVLAEYLDESVKKEVGKSGSADRMSHKIDLARWLKKEKELDADGVKVIMKLYNDDDELDAVLSSVGLKRNDDEEFVAED